MKGLIGRLERFSRFARGRFRTWRPHLAGIVAGKVAENVGIMAAVRRAQAAQREDKLAEATAQWKDILATYPDAAISYAGYGGMLRLANRMEEARIVLIEGAERFPDDLNIPCELTHVYQALGRLDEALALAQGLTARFPDEPQGYALSGQVHRARQRFDEADAVLEVGRARFPSHTSLAVEHAIVADAQADLPESLARWERFRIDFPSDAIGYAGLGAALKKMKRYEEAESVLSAGLAACPDDPNICINHAWLAEEIGDWPEALRRWGASSRRFPLDARIRHGWIECQGKAGIAAIDLLAARGEDGAPILPVALPVDEISVGSPDTPHAALFSRFESLGENCELGFTQRHFGAEPIGLIRWAGIHYDQLMRGLDTGFAGVGSVESTELHVAPVTYEYITVDRDFGLLMHSFINRDDANEARIYSKLRRRLTFLRDKLLEDLALAEKIFVFEGQMPRSDGDLIALHAAARRYGPIQLLCMRVADADNPPGSVAVIGDGLMIGYLDKLGLNGVHWQISYDLWVEICEKVVAIVDGSVASVAG